MSRFDETPSEKTSATEAPASIADEGPNPVRITGFLSLLLGLVGAVSLIGQSLVIVPVVAAAFGLWAMRPYRSDTRPIGYLAGAIGLFAAVLFGVWGVTERSLRDRTLAGQAEAFAGEWLTLVSHGDLPLACELQTPPARRHARSMDLADYYRNSEDGQQAIEAFVGQETVAAIIKAGAGVRWRPERRPQVYAERGRQLTTTVWEDAGKIIKTRIRVEMHYTPAYDGKSAQWAVDQVLPFVEPVASEAAGGLDKAATAAAKF
jgi:hypothetical protein